VLSPSAGTGHGAALALMACAALGRAAADFNRHIPPNAGIVALTFFRIRNPVGVAPIKRVTLSGTLSRVEWKQPHVVMQVDVKVTDWMQYVPQHAMKDSTSDARMSWHSTRPEGPVIRVRDPHAIRSPQIEPPADR